MTAAHIVDGFGRLGTRELQAVAASAGTGTKFLAERMDSPPKVAQFGVLGTSRAYEGAS